MYSGNVPALTRQGSYRKGVKRTRDGAARAASYRYRVPRPIRTVGAIVPLTVTHDIAFTADVPIAFAFDTVNYYWNGTSATIPGASDLAAVYDNLRVMKVEFTVLPNATGLDYSAQTLATGVTNIPYVYHATDYNDATTPGLNSIQQIHSCKTDLLNKVLRRTLYPRIEGSNGVIDLSANYKNQFQKSGTASSQRWNGMKFYFDMRNVVWTYGGASITMKIFFECKNSK